MNIARMPLAEPGNIIRFDRGGEDTQYFCWIILKKEKHHAQGRS